MAPWDTASFCRLSYGLTVPWVSNDKSGQSEKPECQELKVNKPNMVQSSGWSKSWEHFLPNINEHSPALDIINQGFINPAFCASVCHAASATIACSCWGHWKGWLVETSITFRCLLPLVHSRQLHITSQFWGVGHRVFLLCEALLSIVGGLLWGPRKAVTSLKSMLFTHETGIGSMVHWVCMRTMVYKVTVKTGYGTQNLHHLSFQSNSAKSLMKWRLCMRVYVFSDSA